MVFLRGRHFLGFTAVMAALAALGAISTTTVYAEPTQPTHGSFVNAGNFPSGYTLALNVHYKVTNDEDSGNVGYWALDNYNKNVQVWMAPNATSFYAVARYDGDWNTFAGALSPGTGITESSNASGTFHGGYTATFTGTFTPTMKTHGSIGSFDFGGTLSDVLLGAYGSGQTGGSPSFNYLKAYFSGVSGFNESPWGWTYNYKSQTWNNYSHGTTGDILT